MKGMGKINQNQHAYIIEGEVESSILALKHILEEEWGIIIKSNPDIREEHFETFTILDARKLKEAAISKPIGAAGKNIFIIATSFIGLEAQNALLKLLEEPIANTHFFIFVLNANSLLSTVRSRTVTVSLGGANKESQVDTNKFLKSTGSERLKILSTFLSHESETKKSDLIGFLNQLERELSKMKRTAEISKALSEIIYFKKYLFDRSPSVKMISEYLALIIPKAGNGAN